MKTRIDEKLLASADTEINTEWGPAQLMMYNHFLFLCQIITKTSNIRSIQDSLNCIEMLQKCAVIFNSYKKIEAPEFEISSAGRVVRKHDLCEPNVINIIIN
jgi:hypothetical protein